MKPNYETFIGLDIGSLLPSVKGAEESAFGAAKTAALCYKKGLL